MHYCCIEAVKAFWCYCIVYTSLVRYIFIRLNVVHRSVNGISISIDLFIGEVFILIKFDGQAEKNPTAPFAHVRQSSSNTPNFIYLFEFIFQCKIPFHPQLFVWYKNQHQILACTFKRKWDRNCVRQSDFLFLNCELFDHLIW